MSELIQGTDALPCPFCGGEARLSLSRDGHLDEGPLASVHCSGPCMARMPAFCWSEAIRKWNARTPAGRQEVAQ